ncbi:hypothetical protein, partial [Streptomyces microflavus]
MGNAVRDLLWHTGPEVGAELIVRRRLGERPDVSASLARASAERDPSGGSFGRHHDVALAAPGRAHPYRPNLIDLLESGALTVERFLAEAPAVQVLDAAPRRPRLA